MFIDQKTTCRELTNPCSGHVVNTAGFQINHRYYLLRDVRAESSSAPLKCVSVDFVRE